MAIFWLIPFFSFIAHADEVFVTSNTEGLEKVMNADGKYAYLMESSSIQYIIERNCKLTQIGGNLDNKVSGSQKQWEKIYFICIITKQRIQ